MTVLWSLYKSDVRWIPSAYVKGAADDTEKDAVFKTDRMDGYAIVEMKVNSLDTPDRTLESHIREYLSQMLEHKKSYERLGIPVESLCLVTNIPEPSLQPICENLLKKKDYSDLSDVLRVFTPEDYEEFNKFLLKP